MSARIVIAVVLTATTLLASCGQRPGDGPWRTYKQRFITSEGRVTDTGNGNISHTEGQGYAMLFAVANNDRATFDRVWTWTRDTLRRPDGLYSWRYTPGAENPIADRNNATDGDLVMCWALIRAAKAWNRPADRDAAMNLAAALKVAVQEDGDNAYLLPGIEGFTGDNKRVVNLSYWVFPALRDIGAFTQEPLWQRVTDTGLKLIEQARFGSHALPPDWLETSGELHPAENFPPRFGYDAIRVPLYLTWSGHNDDLHIGAIAAFWKSIPAGQPIPAWVDVVTGDLSPEKQSPGMFAVRNLTLGEKAANAALSTGDLITTGDYYSTSLLMLATLAEAEHAR